MRVYKSVPIEPPPGVSPEPDSTESSTPYWTDADKVRFYKGRLRSLGGRQEAVTDVALTGCHRTIFSYYLSNKNRYLAGGSNNLMEIINNVAVNITPVVTATTAVADSLNTNYATLSSNPLTTVSGSAVITVDYSSITDDQLMNGDSVTLSGASTTNGIPDTEINDTHTIGNVDTSANTFTITCSTSASSSGTGGGASVVLATALIGLTKTSHGLTDGERVKVASAATTGGVPDTEINAEHVLRKESDNKFSFYCTTKATSAVSSGGGASTTIQGQIADGECDVETQSGYGGGLYGSGLYGDNQAFSTPAYPRIWFMDRFGNDIVMTPGQQTGTYLYQSDNATAPAALSNAPTAINGLIVDANQILAWGESNVGNRLTASDVGDGTDWTPATDSEAWTDDIEGAEEFISAAAVQGVVLLFTRNQIWQNRYVGKPRIRTTKKLDVTDGIIAPMARAVVAERCYFMGANDLYLSDGVRVQPIPNNTLKRYIYDNINTSQAWKSFAWVNRAFNEVWFHYPTTSDEPDSVARYNYLTGEFVPDTSDLTAAEAPLHLTDNPLAISEDMTIWRFNSGNDDGDSALNSYAETNYFELGNGDTTMYIMGYVHDAIQTGDMKLTVYTKLYPEDTSTKTYGPYTLTSSTQKVNFRAHGRLCKLRFEKTATGTSFMLGRPKLLLQEGYSR